MSLILTQALDRKLEEEKEETIKICDSPIDFKVTRNMFKIAENTEKVYSEKYVPSVVEPSFGIGRILYSLLEHSIWERVDDEHRVVLSLKPRMAPYQIAVLPISNAMNCMAEEVEAILNGQAPCPMDEDGKEEDTHFVDNVHGTDGIATYIDTSSTSIGRKYSRCDTKGIPFAVCCDFQTKKDRTVTLRERDSTQPQIRVKISELGELVADLSRGRRKWKDVVNKYPHHTGQEL